MAAKRKYQDARLSAEAAKVAFIQAKAALMQAQDLYDKAPGIVEKIDMKWVIIDKTNIVNAKTKMLADAMKKFEDALNKCMVVVAKAKGEAVKTTTAAPTEPGSSDVATTRLPTPLPPQPTVIPGFKFNYRPAYKLPSGPAGNPFIRSRAEVTPRIGGNSGQAQYFPYVSQNLNQPEGSEASVPVPGLVKVTTTTEPPPTTAPPVTIDLKLNVLPSSISDMAAFNASLAESVSATTGVNISRVLIESVTKTETSVLLQKKRRTSRLRRLPHQGLLKRFRALVNF